ncbi:MAG: hypothetical protein IPG74_01420 [Flavobacteriales bacterium]|nr:hypothetical protein [Flavobacteriales bacterium]
MYFSLYASGILYNIADLRTDETFRRPIVGLGSGIAFFNGLELNLSYAADASKASTSTGAERRGFANIGFDIPLFDYIRAAREKRAK